MNTTNTTSSKSQGALAFAGSALANLANGSAVVALRGYLVQKLSAEFPNLSSGLISHAVNEAYALAMLTQVPQLVLPILAEEKVQGLRNWSLRQRAISNRPAFALAA